MSLQSSLRDRLRPWHALMLAVFLAGFGVSLAREGSLGLFPLLSATIAGLVGVVLFQFTVGNVWGYAVEYANTGGSWTDWPFLAPFAVGVAAAVTVVVATPEPGPSTAWLALWTAFWFFVVAAAVVALAARFLAGYREGLA